MERHRPSKSELRRGAAKGGKVNISCKTEITPPFPTTKRLYALRKGGVKFAQITYVGGD